LFSEQVLYIKCFVHAFNQASKSSSGKLLSCILPSNQPQLFGIQCAAHIYLLSHSNEQLAQRAGSTKGTRVQFLFYTFLSPDIVECLLSCEAECRLDYCDQTNAFSTSKLQQWEFDDLLYLLWRKNHGIKSYGIFRQASEPSVQGLPILPVGTSMAVAITHVFLWGSSATNHIENALMGSPCECGTHLGEISLFDVKTDFLEQQAIGDVN
jgi:hypothetical protein